MNLWKDFRKDVRKRLETSNEKIKKTVKEQILEDERKRESIGKRDSKFNLPSKTGLSPKSSTYFS